MINARKLLVCEQFLSVSGEVGSVPQGTPMYFVRLAGCNLRCPYCDTKESWEENVKPTDLASLVGVLNGMNVTDIMFTGGEPLLQEDMLTVVIERLVLSGRKRIHIETNGTILPNRYIRDNCTIIYDWKTCFRDMMKIPHHEYYLSNLPCIIKFVVGTGEELALALHVIQTIKLARPPYKAISDPTFAIGSYDKHVITERDIFQTLEHRGMLDVVVNTQIHKLLDLK